LQPRGEKERSGGLERETMALGHGYLRTQLRDMGLQ